MNIQYFDNAVSLSHKAAELVLIEIQQMPQALICAATGNSPSKLYRELANYSELLKGVRIIPLDEWIGLETTEGTCHAYIEQHILEPWMISSDRYFQFYTEVSDIEKECQRIQTYLKKEGPIDICILGMGKNGHLGFNEPAEELKLKCHVAKLADQSQEHSMIKSIHSKPTKGLTLGMNDILSAKKIIVLVVGEGKKESTEQLLSGRISNQYPATWLWHHGNVECLIVK
tara:strand:- start:1039 stop:1725 length:687 start_codon:yes stop_codon:yes gene_type:complete